MQTFLPYPDFARSARVLDRKRLGKQRVETLQVLRAATVPGYGWYRHPATAMWAGHVPALVAYGPTATEDEDELLRQLPDVDRTDGTRARGDE